ncbi:MAG TPA: hypothetical protein PLS53_00055 [Thermoanaerobaculaceae bacterium]|nr:hypothetical protein [Thermoanaerobaculaceae bacterium]
MTRLGQVSRTAQNSRSSGAQHTDRHVYVADPCGVQVMPSGDVITVLVPKLLTAQNNLSSGDQHTLVQ